MCAYRHLNINIEMVHARDSKRDVMIVEIPEVRKQTRSSKRKESKRTVYIRQGDENIIATSDD